MIKNVKHTIIGIKRIDDRRLCVDFVVVADWMLAGSVSDIPITKHSVVQNNPSFILCHTLIFYIDRLNRFSKFNGQKN